MSKQVKVSGFLYVDKDEHVLYGEEGAALFSLIPYGTSTCRGALVGKVEFIHTLPDDFNLDSEILRASITALEADRQRLGEEFARKVGLINERLARLQAITHEPEAA